MNARPAKGPAGWSQTRGRPTEGSYSRHIPRSSALARAPLRLRLWSLLTITLSRLTFWAELHRARWRTQRDNLEA